MSKEDPFSFESIILEPLEEHQDEIDRLREKLRVEWSAAEQQQARAETAEQERDSLRAQLAEMREALEKMMGASRYAHETGDLSPVPEAYNRCEELLARNDTGRDLLERVREAEGLLRRYQEIDCLPQCHELLPTTAGCKMQGGKCLLFALRDDVNRFLREEVVDMTGMFMNCTKLPPKPLLSVSKRGGKDA